MDPQNGFNDLDYSVFAILILSGLLALVRGFVREVFSLGAWTGAYFAAAKFYPLLEPSLHRHIKNPTVVTVIAAASLFIVALILLSIMGSLVCNLIKGHALTSIDRSLGFLFGLFRGALVVVLIYLGATTILWPDLDKVTVVPSEQTKDKVAKLPAPEWLLNARTRPSLSYGAKELKQFIPQSQVEKTTQKYLEQKAQAQHMIDQDKLDLLTTPTVSGSANNDNSKSYDDESRQGLDQLVNQKGSKP